VVVETPVNLGTKASARLIQGAAETLQEEGSKSSRRGPRSWFDGVKNFFEDMKF